MALDPSLGNDELFDDRILGGGLFVKQILQSADLSPDVSGMSLADLIRQVASYFNVEQSRLPKPNKERAHTQAKAVICYVALRELGLRGTDVAVALGYTPAAVSHAAKRGEGILQHEAGLQTLLGVKI